MLEDIVNLVTNNAVLSSVAAALAASVWPVWRAAMAALTRRIDQAWQEQTGGSDDESAIQRVTDSVKADTFMPRGVVKAMVRNRKTNSNPPGQS